MKPLRRSAIRRIPAKRVDWTVAGKVKAIERTSGSSKPGMSFGYSADGQRTSKVGDTLAGGFREHYIRDAQGNKA